MHAFPEALVAEALQDAGHEILYVGCGGVFNSNCVCMTASRVGPDSSAEARSAICNGCAKNKRLIASRFGFDGYDLSEVLGEEQHAQAEELLGRLTPDNFLDLRIAGVEVGRAALSTYLLTYKRSRLQFTDAEWAIFRIELGNTIRSALACQIVLDREKPDRVIVYSSGYSVNLVWCQLAEARNIAFYYMNAGGNLSDRLQKLVIARGHSLQRKLLDYWPIFKDVPCSESVAAYITDHFVELLRGRHVFVYSAPKGREPVDLRVRFGVSQAQRVLLATMSSYDELFAAQATKLFPDDFPLIFPRQSDWLRHLVNFLRARRDLFLIIRVHPREFPNKRDQVKSDHAREIEAALSDLPDNVKVNWPSDEISLYDLADITDVCLNSWSTVGKELGMLGIPVVIYSSDLVFYPAALNYLGRDIEDYFRQIDKALADGWSVERIRAFFRWLALEDRYSRIDISDAFSRKENPRRPLVRKVVDRARGWLNKDFRELDDCRLRPVAMNSAKAICDLVENGRNSVVETVKPSDLPQVSREEETRILKAQMLRIVREMYGRRVTRAGGGLAAHLTKFANS